MTYSKAFYSKQLIEVLLAMTFVDAGIWDLNDVYAWQMDPSLSRWDSYDGCS